MGLVEHAKQECAFMLDGDEMNEAMYRHLIHMVEEFSKEDHSGFSASYAISCLNKLFNYEPLGPLQGTDDEWVNVSESGEVLFQNNRCSRVFKDGNGNAWDIDGKVFVEPDGLSYTSRESHVQITFPYTPKTDYVQVLKNEEE